MPKIAAIRIRGRVNIAPDVKKTLDMLKLYRKNYCSVWDSNKSILGMIEKAKDYITYGEIDENTNKLLVEKKGEAKYFRLAPPRGGFERKGIKEAFKLGGALGYRGEKINELVRKML